MKSVLVSGYYGFGNLGDEAVLGGLVSAFQELCPEASVSVLSSSPRQTKADHDVEAIPRGNLPAIRSGIAACDLFISGGGSLMQDRTSQRSLLYYLGLLYLAQRRGCRTMIMGQGIGPISRATSRWLVRKVVGRTDAITVRDQHSASLLRALVPDCPPPQVTADLAFCFPVGPPADLSKERDKRLGVCLRPWADQQRWLPEVVSALNLLSRENDLEPFFIPLHSPPDRDVMDLLRPTSAEAELGSERRSDGKYGNGGGGTQLVALDKEPKDVQTMDRPEEALEAIGETALVLGMRLHSLIFAAMMGVPFVALAYDPKVEAFADEAGMSCLPLAGIKAAEIVSAVRTLWPKRQEEGERLFAWTERQRSKARENVELALNLLMG